MRRASRAQQPVAHSQQLSTPITALQAQYSLTAKAKPKRKKVKSAGLIISLETKVQLNKLCSRTENIESIHGTANTENTRGIKNNHMKKNTANESQFHDDGKESPLSVAAFVRSGAIKKKKKRKLYQLDSNSKPNQQPASFGSSQSKPSTHKNSPNVQSSGSKNNQASPLLRVNAGKEATLNSAFKSNFFKTALKNSSAMKKTSDLAGFLNSLL